jgi:hypothetical protein
MILIGLQGLKRSLNLSECKTLQLSNTLLILNYKVCLKDIQKDY